MVYRSILVRGESIQIKKIKRGGSKPPAYAKYVNCCNFWLDGPIWTYVVCMDSESGVASDINMYIAHRSSDGASVGAYPQN